MSHPQKQHQIIFELEEDLVEESNHMWRGRFAMAGLIFVCIIWITYLFLELI
jgi:hypothetical protein